ncbi:MAG: aspartate kinase [Nitrospirae bacterium RIFCSPLOW2_12_42_9]|nr:MAG: aspartate kinase [Nitrospirae bacterium GWA2_42_11]OGW57435.1 MAG: aspartate kinase [Nitrospirae bacterium RIFCSPLOW2_12_42_9]OGW58822.1 MAG: aspartate kinase [Nitrospirae bacterium RIFCSPHIGHO2_02_FULL_42_12]HAS18075.1 aspartate kinase [Nitrospiraceae bacterium]HBI24818.1 aspartate kinase [Nitrospiraceae bacterium]
MMLIVQKYGGTSVGSVERIKNVARKIISTRNEGHDVVVVVSAMSGETDRLVSLAHEITHVPVEREMDILLSSGERVTVALLAIALNSMGYPAKAFTGRQVGIVTDSVHTKARIERISGERVQEALKEGVIPVIAGFQGISEGSDVTTLGRGGSDLTAVALAAALKADLCDIYTDVEGVFTTDPNIVSDAKKLDKISYEEMLELASLGAKVLQNRSVEYAAKYGVKVRVLSAFAEGNGTLLTGEDEDMEKVVVSGVTYDRNQSKVTIIGVPDKPGIAARIFGPVAASSIIVDMIIQNVSQESLTDISFTVPRSDVKKTITLMESIIKDIGAREFEVKEDIAKVSIVGVGMRSHSGVALKMFSTLADEGINIMMISTSEIKISCVIDAKYTELAVRALHRAFELGN